MASKTQYSTASGKSLPDLDTMVTNLLREGYQLYGNPYAAAAREESIFCQAVTRDEGESMQEQIERAVVAERPVSVLPIDLPAVR